ncbi:MAG TPA: hypothetical protein VHS03_00150 [Gaiellaceae bacterium]|jgi:hypothetical protein|nr:hypothetical protein [Gaiellaceae bacterium]
MTARLLPLAAAAALLSTGAVALASPASRAATPCTNPTVVRTLTLKLPGGKVSFSAFAAGKTYLVRFSGAISVAGANLGLADAPGAFTVDDLANDVLLSSFPASRLAVAGAPGAYQLAVQRDPGGNALRYGAPSTTSSCPTLAAHPTLPGTTLQLLGAPAPWAGSVRVDVLAYGSTASTGGKAPGGGKTYSANETGSGSFFTRESSKYTFSWQNSSYRATGIQFKLAAQVSEQLGSKNKSPKLVSGTANIAMYLTKTKGSAATKVTEPLAFKLTTVDDLDSTPTGQAFDFYGTLTSAGPTICKKLEIYVDPTSGTVDFHVCNMEGEGKGTATIAPQG